MLIGSKSGLPNQRNNAKTVYIEHIFFDFCTLFVHCRILTSDRRQIKSSILENSVDFNKKVSSSNLWTSCWRTYGNVHQGKNRWIEHLHLHYESSLRFYSLVISDEASIATREQSIATTSTIGGKKGCISTLATSQPLVIFSLRVLWVLHDNLIQSY